MAKKNRRKLFRTIQIPKLDGETQSSSGALPLFGCRGISNFHDSAKLLSSNAKYNFGIRVSCRRGDKKSRTSTMSSLDSTNIIPRVQPTVHSVSKILIQPTSIRSGRNSATNVMNPRGNIPKSTNLFHTYFQYI